MCSIIIIPCELTSQKSSEKRYGGFLTLLWLSCSLYQMEQESDLLRESVTALVFNHLLWISRVAQIKDRPSLPSDVVPRCGAVRRSRQHKALCLPGLRWTSRPVSHVHCQAWRWWKKCFLSVTWKMKQLTAPGTGREDKNNHTLKINTVKITLGMQTHRHTHIFIRKHPIAVMHNGCEHSTSTDHMWVLSLPHNGCWFRGSHGTLMLKSLSRWLLPVLHIPVKKTTILHAPINSHGILVLQSQT